MRQRARILAAAALSTVLTAGSASAVTFVGSTTASSGTGDLVGTAIAVGAAGEVYTASTTYGQQFYGWGIAGGVVSRYDASLAPVWTNGTTLGGGAEAQLAGIGVAGGTVYVAGDARPPAFGLVDSAGGWENKGFTAAFNAGSGASAWPGVTQTPPAPGAFGYGGTEITYGSTTTSDGTTYVTGYGENFSGNGGLWVAQVGADGGYDWKATYATGVYGTSHIGNGVTTLGGAVYVAGVNATALTSNNLVARVNADGTGYTQALLGAGALEAITPFAGGLVAVGASGGNMELVRIDTALAQIGATMTYGAGSLTGVTSAGGNIYAVGRDAGGAVLLEIDGAGALVSALHVPGFGAASGFNAVAAGPDGSLYAIGWTGSGPQRQALIARFATEVTAVPEPSTLVLAGLGLAALLATGRRSRG